MYKTFEINNFRGLKSLSLSQLSRINLVTGKNNVGKTTLLEALFIHSGRHNPDLTMTVNALRGISRASIDLDRPEHSPWDSIFFNFDSSDPVRLVGEIDNDYVDVRIKYIRSETEISGLRFAIRDTWERSKSRPELAAASKILRLEVRREEDFRTRKSKSKKFDADKIKVDRYFLILDAHGKHIYPHLPPSPIRSKLNVGRAKESAQEEARYFGQLQIEGKDEILVKALQILDPRLRQLSVVYESGEPLLEGDIGLERRHRIPLATMGDGMNRLASIIMLIGNTSDGVLMLDEIDAGIHYALMPDIWEAIMRAAQEFSVQIFCTTHSRECVVAAHQAASRLPQYDLTLHRLERSDDKISAVSYDRETIETSIERDFEVR